MSPDCALIWERVKTIASPYPPESFGFVQAGLRHTVESIAAMTAQDAGLAPDMDAGLGGERHLSGEELCLGLRDFAIKQFGLLARTVLESWNIRGTQDFGKIVFIMLDAGLLRKTEEDSISDFDSVYDFDEAFGAYAGARA